MSAILLLASARNNDYPFDTHGHEMAKISHAHNQAIEPFKLSQTYVRLVRAKIDIDNLLRSIGLNGLDFSTTIEKLRNGYIQSDTEIGYFPVDKTRKKHPEYPSITDVYIDCIEYLATNRVNRCFMTSDNGTRDTQVKKARAVLRLLQRKTS